MQRIVKMIPRDCEIIDLGDTHQGTIFFHEKGLFKIIDYVASDKSRFWLHGGDWIEAITSDDKRYDPEIVTELTPLDQKNKIISLFENIKDKGIVGLHGNHERALRRVGPIVREICDTLNIDYGTGMCRIVFMDDQGRHLFNWFTCHGYWLFRSQAKDPEQELANKKASMKMRLKKLMGDCVVMTCHHAHEILIAEPVSQLYLTDGQEGVKQHYLTTPSDLSGYIPPDQRWFGCAGSFRKNQMDGFTDYAEGFSPAELGCLKITIRDGRPVSMEPIKV